jgi:hypothetical protein
MVEMKLEATIARVIAEGKVRTYDMSAIGRTRRGEGGKDSTLDVAQAVADYAGLMKKAAHETCEWTRNCS